MKAPLVLPSVCQQTDSHCGPAVVQMLLSHRKILATQDEIARAGRALGRMMEYGTRPDQLGLAVTKLAPGYTFWFKQPTTTQDLVTLVHTYGTPVAVNWQGLFYDTPEEEAVDFPKTNIYGDHGHYSVIVDIDPKNDTITIADPYSEYYRAPRTFSYSWFESRWWDKDVKRDPKTKRNIVLTTDRFCFIVAPSKAAFPKTLGMQLREHLPVYHRMTRKQGQVYKNQQLKHIQSQWDLMIHGAHDGRRPSKDLIKQYNRTLTAAGWHKHVITYQRDYPILAFISPAAQTATSDQPLDTLWIEGGVHGEEPASGEAFAQELRTLVRLGLTVPIVLLPLLNPSARDKDWRYENEYRDFNTGLSVTDSEHYLLKLTADGRPALPYAPRTEQPAYQTAAAITSWVLNTSFRLKPLLVFDHHEDRVPERFPKGDPRNIRSCYAYLSGGGNAAKAIADAVVSILKETGMPIAAKGLTRFGEPIANGVVRNAADGSMDELHSSALYYDRETQTAAPKPAAETVIVVETTIPFNRPIPLAKRVDAHRAVIKNYGRLWVKAVTAAAL